LTNTSQLQGHHHDTEARVPTEGDNKSLNKSQIDQNRSLNKSHVDQNKSLNKSQLDQSVNVGDKSLERTHDSVNQSALNESRLQRIQQNGSELIVLNPYLVQEVNLVID
jgi:hypothetical protein